MEKNFSNFCNCGIMDSNFKTIWSDNRLIFYRLSKGVRKLLKFRGNNPSCKLLYHDFKVIGRWYRARIQYIPNGTYFCRVAKEIEENDITKAELNTFIGEMVNSSLNVYSMIEMLVDYYEEGSYIPDEVHAKIKEVQKEAGNVYAQGYNILHAFENEHDKKFIPLTKYIIRSWDVAHFATRRLKNAFDFNIDITFPYAKLDYSKFELALFNLIKIVLIYSADHNKPIINIKTTDMGKIDVWVDFPCNNYCDIKICEIEIRSIQYIFGKMGGKFELQESDGTIHAYGSIRCDFSCDENEMENGMDIEFINDPDRIIKKENYKRYIKIYENSNKKLRFASGVDELEDIDSSVGGFAEAFFSKVFIFRNK